MNLFEYKSYKNYVLDRVQAMPRQGHGQFTKIAKHVAVNPVIVTQVLKGDRDFSEEQGLRLAEFLGLKKMETEYFMRLLAKERAGTHDLKKHHEEALEGLRREARKVKNRVAPHSQIDDQAKSIFYSDWSYGAVRLCPSIKGLQSPEAMALHLGLPLEKVQQILSFLVEVGLCREVEKGVYAPGLASTHLDAQSPFINMQRRNWRLKSLEALNQQSPEELFYSGVCSLSETDFQAMKSAFLDLLADFSKRVPKSKPEVLACMNIDWFKCQALFPDAKRPETGPGT